MALMVASRRLAAGYWCVSAEQRQGPALLRVLRNSPRAMPLPANSGPASDDALVILRSVLFRYVMQLGQTLMMCAAFTSSMYLLLQRGGQNRLFCLRHCIHVCRSGLSAHVMQFLNGHGGK